MRRDQSRRLGPFYNPGCEDAWILAIGCFDLAPTVNFRPKRVFRARHLHEMTMLRFNRVFCLSDWGDAWALGIDRQECLSYFRMECGCLAWQGKGIGGRWMVCAGEDGLTPQS
jgi:hypothetical protein